MIVFDSTVDWLKCSIKKAIDQKRSVIDYKFLYIECTEFAIYMYIRVSAASCVLSPTFNKIREKSVIH